QRKPPWRWPSLLVPPRRCADESPRERFLGARHFPKAPAPVRSWAFGKKNKALLRASPCLNTIVRMTTAAPRCRNQPAPIVFTNAVLISKIRDGSRVQLYCAAPLGLRPCTAFRTPPPSALVIC